MGLVKEFREFAVKGNAMDMAVGIIIGGAFGKIVSSLVGDVVMPLVGLLAGGVDFTGLSLQLTAPLSGDPVTLKYGQFIQTVFDFTIVAFAIFMMVKGLNSLRKNEEAAPASPPAPSAEETLLAEIRDLLKK